ncbi:MAG: TonB-dependent receptor [Halioglobus sp.]|nr:TonB-dependent receptor [Halioglobus sp.]
MNFNLNYGWQDEVSSDVLLDGNFIVDSYGLLGAAASWAEIRLGSLPGSLRLLLWGRNLLDEEYGSSGQTALEPFGADETQIFGEPRTYGLTLSYRY